MEKGKINQYRITAVAAGLLERMEEQGLADGEKKQALMWAMGIIEAKPHLEKMAQTQAAQAAKFKPPGGTLQ